MATDDDLDSGLFNIALSDSEGEDATTETTRDRTGQTEEEYQAVKRAYRPKIDNGEVSSLLFLLFFRLRRTTNSKSNCFFWGGGG